MFKHLATCDRCPEAVRLEFQEKKTLSLPNSARVTETAAQKVLQCHQYYVWLVNLTYLSTDHQRVHHHRHDCTAVLSTAFVD